MNYDLCFVFVCVPLPVIEMLKVIAGGGHTDTLQHQLWLCMKHFQKNPMLWLLLNFKSMKKRKLSKQNIIANMQCIT